MSATLFSGNIRIAVVSALGVVTGGYIGLLNATKLALTTPDPKNPQQISKANLTYGQIKSQAFLPVATSMEITIDDTNDQRVLGWAYNGTVTGVTQASATVTAESITAVVGDWVPIANRQVTSLVVKDSTDTTTYVAGTDYIADALGGFIQVLSSGSISAGDTLHVGYTAPALTGDRIDAAQVTSRYFRVDGDLVNLVDQSRSHLVVPVFQGLASGANDLLGDNLLVSGLKGNMLSPDGITPPFTLTRYA